MELLSEEAVNERLSELTVAWAAIGNDYLVRAFKTADFRQGISFLNKIADLADKLEHHPDVSLTYTRLELRLSTHSVAGITDADFAFAHEIDKLVAE